LSGIIERDGNPPEPRRFPELRHATRNAPLMHLSQFDFHLPEQQIAQQPLADRAASRMLVLDRGSGTWEDRHFLDLPAYLRPGDCLVLNDTRVLLARLHAERRSGGRVEILLLRPVSGDRKEWRALVRPGRKMPAGERVRVAPGVEAEVTSRGEHGERTLRFHMEEEVESLLERVGHMPLPPYLKRPDEASDRTRYQTVYARHSGSAAAPTAGLHFTPEMLARCRAAGAEIATVTLHVGLGTFQPLTEDEVERNRLHSEAYEVKEPAMERLRSAKRRVAVGTTSARTLESAWQRGPHGETDLFIYPGYQFQAVDALLTNFHLPRSSLLLLVSALAGREFVMDAYRHAVAEGYRFFSYGDCMLIL